LHPCLSLAVFFSFFFLGGTASKGLFCLLGLRFDRYAASPPHDKIFSALVLPFPFGESLVMNFKVALHSYDEIEFPSS